MRFLTYLNENKYVPYKKHYINYEYLKNLIKSNLDDKTESFFLTTFEEDFTRVFEFIKKKYDSLCAQVTVLETNKEFDEFHTKQLKKITDEIYSFGEFIRINNEGFKRILKKHDRITKFSLYPKFSREMRKKIQQLDDLNKLLYRVSRLKLKTTVVKSEKESNSSFIRKTCKYWVHPENLTALKLKILKHLPIYVFNNNESGTPYSAWNHERHDNTVSSVYFDNSDFELYSFRIRKNQGSEAIRLRWYGSEEPKTVFIERKRHEESWTGEKSKKLRFKMKEEYVLDYLNGKDIWAHVKEENGKEVYELYKEIQDVIVNKKLRPVVRTFYKRSAFQLPNDSSVRISIDTNLTMIKESTDAEMISNVFPLKRWRRENINCEWPFEALPKEEIVRFPYAIMEIKTQSFDEQKPEWINDIIASSYVENVQKFSKFMHGCAVLYRNISIIPYWLPQLDTEIRKDEYHSIKRTNTIENGKIKSLYNDIEASTSTGLSLIRNHPKKIAVPIKIEPKVYFANERTFLKWIQFAIFLGGTGITILGLGDYEASLCGLMLIIVAIMFSFYGLYLYSWRNNKIIKKDMTPYDDLSGPTLLIIMFLAAMMFSIIFKIPIKKKFI